MKIKTKVEEPEKVEITISITMPLKDWQTLANQLPQNWPSWELGSVIRDSVQGIKKQVMINEK